MHVHTMEKGNLDLKRDGMGRGGQGGGEAVNFMHVLEISIFEDPVKDIATMVTKIPLTIVIDSCCCSG